MARQKKQPVAPPYFSSLSLSRFRGFKRVHAIPLRPLTFLVGPNSSGKSSLLDAIFLFAQSSFGNLLDHPLLPEWSGDLVDLGSYGDCVHTHDTGLPITIALEVVLTDRIRFESTRRPSSSRRIEEHKFHLAFSLRTTKTYPEGRVSRVDVIHSASGVHLEIKWSQRRDLHLTFRAKGMRTVRVIERGKERPWQVGERAVAATRKSFAGIRKSLGARDRAGFQALVWLMDSPYLRFFTGQTERVSSGRAGPKRWYPQATAQKGFRRFGPMLFEQVDPAMLELVESQFVRPQKSGGRTRRTKLAEVLRELDIASGIAPGKLSPYHSAIKVTDNITGVSSHLIDVGYGASQVIPVIAGCLSERPGPLLVEQPEIHLHPRAQATIAKLLCETSKKRQVIVETHSEHLINQARIMVAEGLLNSEDVIINFVQRDKQGSNVHVIPIKPDGEFGADWPLGFFDERYQDTMKLLRIKNSGGA